MQFFADSADISAIKALNEQLPIEGVTTNPSLILKSGGKIAAVLGEICAAISGPVSAEVTADDYETMREEAPALAKIAANICVKLPMTYAGLRVCRELSGSGHKTNMTLCFSLPQALLAAKANAAYVSPFIGRLDDSGADGLALIGEIRRAYAFYGYKTKILAASVRSLAHISGAALMGADAITAPPQLLHDMVHHELTEKGLAGFKADWAKTGQNILA